MIFVEDNPDDVELLVHELLHAGVEPDWVRVQTREALERALRTQDHAPEIVLCDWILPGFSGPAALELVREVRPGLPCVVVSGAEGEHTAVLAMKAGAADFVVKGRTERLPFIILREVEAAAGRPFASR